MLRSMSYDHQRLAINLFQQSFKLSTQFSSQTSFKVGPYLMSFNNELCEDINDTSWKSFHV